jgi:hypothetical protein
LGKQLSILCVTRGQLSAEPFLRAMNDLSVLVEAEFVTVIDPPDDPLPGSKGYIESVLEDAISQCSGRYILRLDDDERCSPAMVEWVWTGRYLEHPHWSFPRMHMFPDAESVMLAPQLWPDHQTRLSLKEMSGGRHHLHAPSPFGMGEYAPVAIEHHKFLVRTRAQREETARLWHSGGMTAFSLPEDVLKTVKIVSRGDGTVPWTPDRVEEVEL